MLGKSTSPLLFQKIQNTFSETSDFPDARENFSHPLLLFANTKAHI